MDEEQRKRLDEIYQAVQETRTGIEVVDERTQHLDARMDGIEGSVQDNEEDLETVEKRVNRNSTALGAIVTGTSATIFMFAEKIIKLL